MRFLRHWPVLLALLVPLCAVVDWAGGAWIASRVPPAEAYADARRIVAAEHQPGDLVLVTPDWLGQGRVALGDWMPLEDQARAEALGYPRIWDLSLPDRQAPETEGLPAIRSWDLDTLTLTLYRNTRYGLPLWRALDEIASARVAVRTPDGDRPCRWDARARRQQCGDQFGEPWVYVGPIVIADMDQRALLCLWAHPTDRGPLVVTFDDVPSGVRLTGGTGLTYVAGRDRDKTPVVLVARVDEVEVGSVVHPDAVGRRTFDFPVPPGPERRRVTFEVSSEFQGMRHFCFDATMRGSE
jgi:hypothetical protein